MIENYFPFTVDNFNTIQEELYSLYGHLTTTDQLQTNKIDWTRENFLSLYDKIEELFIGRDESVATARLFYTPPHAELETHVDGDFIAEKYWALNIPIWVDSENHYQEWFSYNGELYKDVNNVYASSIKPKNPEKLVSVDRLVLLNPHFVKVGIFHKVVNNSSQGRLVLSIRFNSKRLGKFIESLKEAYVRSTLTETSDQR